MTSSKASHFFHLTMKCFIISFIFISTSIIHADISYTINVIEDAENNLVLEDFLSSSNSESKTIHFNNIQGRENYGVTNSAFWFKIDIPSQNTTEAILEVGYPLLDEVDIYTQVQNTKKLTWQALNIGDTRPIENREISHRNFLKAISIGKPQQIYIRVHTEGPSNIPIIIKETATYYKDNTSNTLIKGLYYGVLFAVVLFNLSIFFSTKDLSYLYYVGYIGFIGIFLVSLDGFFTQYVFDNKHFFSSRVPFASLCIAMLSGFKFASSVNNTSELSPKLVNIFNYFSLILIIVVLSGFFIGIRFLSIATPILAVVSIALYVHAIIVGIRSGHRLSLFVGLTFLAIIPGGVFYGIKPFGIIDQAGLLDHSFHIGVALDAILLSIILSYRVKMVRDQLENTRMKMALSQEHFSRRLIASRDKERRELAADLHDGLGQNLLVIKNKLSRELGSRSDNLNNVSSAQHIVQSTIDDVRRLSHELHPHILDRLGLKDAVMAVIENTFDDVKYPVECHIDNIKLPEKSIIALNIYRILQESVKNIVTHATPKRVEINLLHDEHEITLHIEDFANNTNSSWANKIELNQCFGLNSIHERVKLLNGQTTFSNNVSGGFKITIVLPFLENIGILE